ncbi:MAG: radical SAM protein [Elusimicrobiota bacterium]
MAGVQQPLERRLSRIEWRADRRPRVCEVMLNAECNARCLFCYNPMEDPVFRSRSMSVEQAARSLAVGRREGCWIACLIGGEPTLRADLGKIALLARKLGYACVKVVTNGLKLSDPAYARSLVDSGVNCFNISIHGPSAEIHDRLVGVPGAFEKCLRALENARDLGVAPGVDHVFTRVNAERFPEYFEMMLWRHEVSYFNMIYPHYRGVMAGHRSELGIRYSELAPHVRSAMRSFLRHGLPAFSRVLVNFPPCVLPGYEHITADWDADPGGRGEPLFGTDGTRSRMDAMKAAQRVKPPRCRRCVYDARCLGVDREYVELFGSGEFVPLRSVPERAPIRALYER